MSEKIAEIAKSLEIVESAEIVAIERVESTNSAENSRRAERSGSEERSESAENLESEEGSESSQVAGKPGILYMCATPIGNLGDITIRVLDTLRKVDLIAAEDTRHSIKLLNHYEIKTPMTSYHEFNKVEKARYLVDKMRNGTNVALITDAGTPGISDPGEELVIQCHEAGIELTSLPGPAACITALTISGRSTRRFVFEAFLPSDKKERKDVLLDLINETRTIIIYEAPHRLVRTLVELKDTLGEDRALTICKELTKRYEKTFLTPFGAALDFYDTKEPRGEYVLIIQGKSKSELIKEKQDAWEVMSVEEHVNMYIEKGNDKKESMRLAAKDRGISKRDVYQLLLQI